MNFRPLLAKILIRATNLRLVELAKPSPEQCSKIVRQALRKTASSHLASILAEVLSTKQILVVRNPSKLPASFVKLCHADALLESALVGSKMLQRTRQEAQGQLAALVLVSQNVSEIGTLLEELETIFEHELQVAELRATLIAQRSQLMECLEAELEMASDFRTRG
jgi:hypothetical protein